MDRVKTLIKKLQEQVDANAPVQYLVQTVQMLQAELQTLAAKAPVRTSKRVSVVMPSLFPAPATNENNDGNPKESEEKVVHTLHVDEKEIEEELEQIKKHASAIQTYGHHTEMEDFNLFEEVPTLSHQNLEKLNEKEIEKKVQQKETNQVYETQASAENLNEKLKESKVELSQTLSETPIKDLRKAISVNDRFQFINELFRGDESIYERSLRTIQSFSIFAEAEFWIRRELKIKIGWDDNDPVVKHFDEMIRRRFL